MQMTLAVTQVPHSNFFNGGVASDARAYFLRETQGEAPGPKIDTAIAGIVPGEIRLIVASVGSIYKSRDPSTGSTYDTVDWTPANAWHAGTQQLIHGGTRKINKISIYADRTGKFREEAMPRTLAQFQQYGHWYGRTATDGVKILMQDHFYYPETGEWSGPVGVSGWNSSYAWFPEFGAAGGWVGGSTDVSVFDEATQTNIPLGDMDHAGGHELRCHHPAHGKVLTVGGSDYPTKATILNADGSFAQVADCPAPVSMSAGTGNIVAHPAGCWLVVTESIAPRQAYAYWPTQDVWQSIGPIGGPTITYPTLAWDSDRQIAYLTGRQGIFAWKLPNVTEPGA
jgi:hypothetical protein